MKIYAIVVSHNGREWIRNCLHSVEQSLLPVHVMVIDNASTDDTASIVENGFPTCTLVRLRQNIGFGAACNVGMTQAMEEGAEYVFLLNQDARIAPSTIETLVQASEIHPLYGILSPLHYARDGESLDYFFSRYLPEDLRRLFAGPSLSSGAHQVYTVPFVNAALWLIPCRVLTKTGLFDPIFFIYGEDNDLVHRMQFGGFQVGICPQAMAFHDRDQRKLRSRTSNVARNKSEAGYLVTLLNPNDSYNLAWFKAGVMALRNLTESVLASPGTMVRELGTISRIIGERRTLRELRSNRIYSYRKLLEKQG